uniref:NADH-ubiquinone oxidoreductase chain 2 n=1 Tax=Sophonia linealis TaxID=2038641 RepID=A0A343K7Z3_9HEMI|nr:NADH dehydrogenase subunit 2 [Sophonia linealis]
MKLNLTMILFLVLMIVGVIITLSSNNFMMMWVGLELSLMSFIPVMSMNGFYSSESCIKYFLIQSISSCMFILGLLFMFMNNDLSNFLVVFSLMLKVGLAPFHLWLLSLVEGLNYFMLFILLTLMKISPLFIMSYLNFNYSFFILISLIVGSFNGLNQNSLRKLISLSSIFNMGFVISVIFFNNIWPSFMFIYTIILFTVLMSLNLLKINYLNQMMINLFGLKMKLILWLSMLSLGGLPPLLGFLNKIIVFEMLFLMESFFMLTVMILTSLLVMFFYTRICIIFMMFFSLTMKWKLVSHSNPYYYLVLFNLLFPSAMMLKSII